MGRARLFHEREPHFTTDALCSPAFTTGAMHLLIALRVSAALLIAVCSSASTNSPAGVNAQTHGPSNAPTWGSSEIFWFETSTPTASQSMTGSPTVLTTFWTGSTVASWGWEITRPTQGTYCFTTTGTVLVQFNLASQGNSPFSAAVMKNTTTPLYGALASAGAPTSTPLGLSGFAQIPITSRDCVQLVTVGNAGTGAMAALTSPTAAAALGFYVVPQTYGTFAVQGSTSAQTQTVTGGAGWVPLVALWTNAVTGGTGFSFNGGNGYIIFNYAGLSMYVVSLTVAASGAVANELQVAMYLQGSNMPQFYPCHSSVSASSAITSAVCFIACDAYCSSIAIRAVAQYAGSGNVTLTSVNSQMAVSRLPSTSWAFFTLTGIAPTVTVPAGSPVSLSPNWINSDSTTVTCTNGGSGPTPQCNTATGQITIGRSGYHLVYFNDAMTTVDTTGDPVMVYVQRVSGSTTTNIAYASAFAAAGTASQVRISGSALVELTSGDVLSMVALSNSGTVTVTFEGSNIGSTTFAAVFITAIPAPTNAPTTLAPSAAPSHSPVPKPTEPSSAPSAAPSISAFSLTPLIYQSSSSFSGGEIGNRIQSSQLCAVDHTVAALKCIAPFIWAMVGYAQETLTYANAIVPGLGVAFNASKPVFSPEGFLIAANWSQFFQFGPELPLATANVSRGPVIQRALVWTGIRALHFQSPTNGAPGESWQTCLGWTSSSPVQQGIVGFTQYTTYQAYNTPFGRASDTCDHAYPLLCACLADVPATISPTHSPAPTEPPTWPTNWPTFAPTRSPSMSPTVSRPSPAPSKSPSHTPSKSPSHSPSRSPSREPTLHPTLLPTPLPTPAPTYLVFCIEVQNIVSGNCMYTIESDTIDVDGKCGGSILDICAAHSGATITITVSDEDQYGSCTGCSDTAMGCSCSGDFCITPLLGPCSPTSAPTTASPTSASPTSASPTSASPTSASPTTASPNSPPTSSPTSMSPTSLSPTTGSPTVSPNCHFDSSCGPPTVTQYCCTDACSNSGLSDAVTSSCEFCGYNCINAGSNTCVTPCLG